MPTERAQIIRGCQIRVSLSWGVKSCKMAGLLPIDWTGFILRSKQEADLAMFQHWFKFDSQLQKNPWFSQFKLVGPAIYSFYSQNRFDTEQPNYVFFFRTECFQNSSGRSLEASLTDEILDSSLSQTKKLPQNRVRFWDRVRLLCSRQEHQRKQLWENNKHRK